MADPNTNIQLPAAMHRLRVGAEAAHYGGGLVDGAYLLKLFGDVATELMIRQDGTEGLFRAYESVEFFAPVYGGDILEVFGEILQLGKTSRKMKFVVHKVIAGSRDSMHPDRAEVLAKPIKVAEAVGTCVLPPRV